MTLNVHIADGYVDGATGIMRHIDYNILGKQKIANTLWIEFDVPKIGRKARKANAKFQNTRWSPVTSYCKSFQYGRSSRIMVDRKQFPVVCAEGITIHKSQGGTH